ncbi:hypothetical protein AAVH_23117 [Aphelenchoides avenae]|nr:hypothetical protein AAVH_23117 [Aphelenchus avenae]
MARYYEAHRPVLGTLLLSVMARNLLAINFSFTLALYFKYPISHMHYVVDTLTETKEIPGFSQYVYYLAFIIIDLAALAGLYAFGRINAKKKIVLRRTGNDYTVRESYQLSENVAFVKIFIPVATAYFLLNTGCHLTAVLIRNFVTTASEIDKVVWIEAQYVLYILSTVFCLSVYAYRLWKHKSLAFVRTKPLQDEGSVYFDQFRATTEGVAPSVVF